MTYPIGDATFVILGGDPSATRYTEGLVKGHSAAVLHPGENLPQVDTAYVVLVEAGEAPDLQRCRHAVLAALRDGLDLVVGPHAHQQHLDWDAATAYADRVALLNSEDALGQACVVRTGLLQTALNESPGRSRRMLIAHAVVHGLALDLAWGPLAQTGIETHPRQLPSELVDEWIWIHDQFENLGINYLRDHVAQVSLPQLLHRLIFAIEDRPVRDDGFAALRALVLRFGTDLPQVAVSRHQDVLDAANADDPERFEASLRLRMVVAGHDLKFVEGFFDTFRVFADLRIDQWRGHEEHEAEVSQELAEWADLVFAEWLLGAAEFYSNRVQAHQRLAVRCHRVDMMAKFGLSVAWDKVDRLIAIAPHTLHDFVDRFDIPREKLDLIPNWFDVDAYQRSDDPDRVYTIAMIGSLPKLKGLHRAYELINTLRQADTRYQLRIYGKRPEELDWLMRRDAERAYYEGCERYLAEHGLEDHVSHEGWIDTRSGLHDIGFVVSLSDFEGMQVSVGEAYCADAAGLMLNWRGAEQCYPEEFVFSSPEEIAQFILEHSDPTKLDAAASRGREFVRTRYDKSVVTQRIRELLSRL